MLGFLAGTQPERKKTSRGQIGRFAETVVYTTTPREEMNPENFLIKTELPIFVRRGAIKVNSYGEVLFA